MSSISKAMKVSCADMAPSPDLAPLPHGGDLAAARKLFPGAPEPFLDLSTGINPNPYPAGTLPSGAFTELPQPDALARLAAIAAAAYGAPSPAHVVATPGSQIAAAQLAASVAPGRALVLGPTYAEHARAAALAGHDVAEASDVERLGDASLAIVVNPNNPDGGLVTGEALLSIAERLHRRGGLLMVDEAFMEAAPQAASLAGSVAGEGIAVLRSFGKFYGLPGLRLSFAIAGRTLARRLAAALGPWPVSGAALAVGAEALADRGWQERTRATLEAAARRLDIVLESAGMRVIGGTVLFRLARTPQAQAMFRRLGEQGVLVRRFERERDWLRFGLPGDEPAWRRLEQALAICGRTG
jgi:cobalamin biosynthetic protein CobC